MNGSSIKQAFVFGKNAIAGGPREDCSICCCEHSHKPDCLFYAYVEKHKWDWDSACRKLHHDTCNCYKRLAEEEKKEGKAGDEESNSTFISHTFGCESYKNFYYTLVKSTSKA